MDAVYGVRLVGRPENVCFRLGPLLQVFSCFAVTFTTVLEIQKRSMAGVD
jgi:hypothetical protein